MKIIARKAYLFSFIFIAPLLVSLSQSKAGHVVTNGDTIVAKDNTHIIVQPVVPKRDGVDSMLKAIYSLQKQTNTRLDTGLTRQLNYIRNQNFLAEKVIQMHNKIQELEIKSSIPAQVAKDAERGNSKRDVIRLMVGILIGIILIIFLIAGIFVEVRKSQLTKKTIPN